MKIHLHFSEISSKCLFAILRNIMHVHAHVILVYAFFYRWRTWKTALKRLQECEYQGMAMFQFMYCFIKWRLGELTFKSELNLGCLSSSFSLTYVQAFQTYEL